MRASNIKVYLIFTLTFLVMHFTGGLVADLPYIFNALITAGAVISALVILIVWTGQYSFRNVFKETGVHSASFRNMVPGIILAGVMLLVYPLMHLFLGMDLILTKDWMFNLLGLLLTGGLTEEMLFRGYLFGTLRRQWSFLKAAFVSAVFFTLAHLVLFTYMYWPIALMSTLLAVTGSVPLAYLYEKGNFTVWSPALVHTVIRTVGMVVTTGEENSMTFSMVWILGCMLLPYLALLCFKDFRNIWKKEQSA